MQKWGWIGGTKAKDAMLGELGIALAAGISSKTEDYKKLILHDKEMVDELFDDIFRDSGSGCVVSKKADLSTGALERHGDRVITAGLAVVAMREQIKGDFKQVENPPLNSFQRRFNLVEEQGEKEKRDQRTFLF